MRKSLRKFGPNSWIFHLSASIDNVRDDGNVNAGMRTRNTMFFGNATYKINPRTSVGMELTHRSTKYKGSGTSKDMRIQTKFKYKF